MHDLEQVFPNLKQRDYSRKVPHLYEIFVGRIVALICCEELVKNYNKISAKRRPQKGPKGIDVHLNLPRPIKIKRSVGTNQSEQSSRGGLFEA